MKKINHIASKKFVIYAKKKFVSMIIKKNHKVRDHCYYNGNYRDAAHNICNLKSKTQK